MAKDYITNWFNQHVRDIEEERRKARLAILAQYMFPTINFDEEDEPTR